MFLSIAFIMADPETPKPVKSQLNPSVGWGTSKKVCGFYLCKLRQLLLSVVISVGE